ncbi:hypothetical protein E2C01_007450 [Portunus trituberculatus]|uniref:Uncharacterized protein n=1 Tax=Portunus trituberculatus TaxID=210409 RepID=A0A5B7CZA2_PORTR|nr:hypothetical protein [Portunus trituberculatus]
MHQHEPGQMKGCLLPPLPSLRPLLSPLLPSLASLVSLSLSPRPATASALRHHAPPSCDSLLLRVTRAAFSSPASLSYEKVLTSSPSPCGWRARKGDQGG